MAFPPPYGWVRHLFTLMGIWEGEIFTPKSTNFDTFYPIKCQFWQFLPLKVQILKMFTPKRTVGKIYFFWAECSPIGMGLCQRDFYVITIELSLVQIILVHGMRTRLHLCLHVSNRDRKGKVCYVTQVTWVQNLTFGWYWSREKLSIFIFSYFIFSCVGIRAIIEKRSSSSCWRDDFSEEEKKFLENFLTNE